VLLFTLKKKVVRSQLTSDREINLRG